MPAPHLLGPRPASAPAEIGISRGYPTDIPYDLLQAASRRLGIMSLLMAVLWVLGTVLYHFAARAMSRAKANFTQPDGTVQGAWA